MSGTCMLCRTLGTTQVVSMKWGSWSKPAMVQIKSKQMNIHETATIQMVFQTINFKLVPNFREGVAGWQLKRQRSRSSTHFR